MRRTVARYLNLAHIMTFRLMCLPVKKRFPTLDHLVEAGVLMEKEKKVKTNNIIYIKIAQTAYAAFFLLPIP